MESVPYIEKKICERVYIRNFSYESEDEEFKWHTDPEDRIIIPISENDWKFQEDNKLPVPISFPISIKNGIWHRLIKGSCDLSIKVIKL